MASREEIRKGIEKYTKNPAALWKYLHENGIVIKVEDDSFVAECLRDSWEEIKEDMKQAGYAKFVPLIEKER